MFECLAGNTRDEVLAKLVASRNYHAPKGILSSANSLLTRSFFAAFTRSIARSDQVLNPALGSIFFTPRQSGALTWDAPNRLLAWDWTPTHIWSVQVSYFFEYGTGYPFSVISLRQQLVGSPNSVRFPPYVSRNPALERKFGFHGNLWAARIEAVNALDRPKPNTAVNNIDAPNFGRFFRRATTGLHGENQICGKKIGASLLVPVLARNQPELAVS